jgi:hypothetical protein
MKNLNNKQDPKKKDFGELILIYRELKEIMDLKMFKLLTKKKMLF